MEAEPNFAFDVLRPAAVVVGYLISMRLGWALRDWWIKRQEQRAIQARNVTVALRQPSVAGGKGQSPGW